MIPEKDNVNRINQICDNLGWGGDAYSVKQIIQRAFPLNWKYRRMFKKLKPDAWHLIKALSVAETYLATQDMDEIIEWAYRKDFPF